MAPPAPPAPAPEAAPAAAPAAGGFGPGTYEVGTAPGDVPPGKYKSLGPTDASSICYWARLTDAGGSLESIIANDVVQGPSVVTVMPTDGAFKIGGCTFTRA